MKSLAKFGVLVLILLSFLVFCAGAAFSQGEDLNKQKQEKLEQIAAIDAKLKAGPTAEEYDQLIKEREKLEAEVKEINKKLMADADAMKRINAVKKAYNDGNNAFKLGQYQEALDDYNKAIALDSTFALAYYGKGLALKKLRKYEDATDAYRAAVRHNKMFSEAYIALGKIYSERGMVDNAVKTYEQAIQNDPSSEKAYYELGAIYLNKKKNYNKAAQNFTKATQIDPEYDLAFYSLGVALTELGRLDEGLLALENAIAVSKRKRWEEPHYRMAVIYNKQGQYSNAKQAADEALSLSKNYAPAAYEAGKACKELGQLSEAINYFQIAAKNRVWKRAAEYEIDMIQNRNKYGGN